MYPNACGPVGREKPRVDGEKKKIQCFATSGTKGLAKKKKKTNLYGSPPGNANAPRRVLEGNSPAHRNEAW